jgi:uncharacterized protein (DUF983 family)
MESDAKIYGGVSAGHRLALWRGFGRHCPRCGTGAIFRRYLEVNATCPACGLDLAVYPVDDAPPYFTILLVGHIVVPGMVIVEELLHPASWVESAIWLPLTLALALFFLPRVKGALIGLHWANRIVNS